MVLAYRPWGEAEEAWSSHPEMSSREAMHGESTRARIGERATRAGVKWRPVTELLVFESRMDTPGVTERSEQRARYSENRQTRTRTRSVRLS